MVKTIARCVLVTDGGTLRTDKLVWVCLARVHAPSLKTPGGQRAKRTLESIVLFKDIFYEPVRFDETGRIVAEVWVGGTNVNDQMLRAGYHWD
jgi:endonuclease YncB( thermonuclease family)